INSLFQIVALFQFGLHNYDDYITRGVLIDRYFFGAPFRFPFPFNNGFNTLPVCDRLTAATSSGVPLATTRPPCAPPSGPRSMMKSALLITSRLCSITITVLPTLTRR